MKLSNTQSLAWLIAKAIIFLLMIMTNIEIVAVAYQQF
jgi:hypothetical protein